MRLAAQRRRHRRRRGVAGVPAAGLARYARMRADVRAREGAMRRDDASGLSTLAQLHGAAPAAAASPVHDARTAASLV